MLVVHPHFHPRRTGVTSHTELVVPALRPLVDARAMGELLDAGVPRITAREVLAAAKADDVIWHAHRNNEVLWGLALKLLRKRVRLVFTRHGSNPPGWLTRWLFAKVDALVTLNDEVAALAGHPSRIVQHGVSLARFRPPVDRAAAWKALGLPGSRGIGVVGRIRAEKGQGDFVRALVPLLDAHPDWTPVLIGLAKGADLDWARSLVAETKGRLVLAGEQQDVVRWYQGLSIVAQPSHREAFSMVHLEAMASGAGLVASRLPYLPSVVDDGRTGFLYPPGDVEALRALLARLMSTPALAEAAGRAAAEEAKARFGVEREARALAELYQQVLQSA